MNKDELITRIEQEIKVIDTDNLGCMTLGGAICDKLEQFDVAELLAFCCEKLKLKELVWNYLASQITAHYVMLDRYEKEAS